MYNFGMTISVPDTDPDEVFKTLSDYERYPELTEAVLQASVERGDDGHERCTWEVKFRRGILVWTEEGTVDAAQRRIKFFSRRRRPRCPGGALACRRGGGGQRD